MILKIKGKFQHYDWGGKTTLPKMFDIANPQKQPFAEYWMGAHPLLPSNVEKLSTPLDKYIDKPLPFLTKILDVQKMLSIQIHPQKQQADKGFKEEEKKGISITSSSRTYKDPNEKEESLIPWSNEFWLLYGFRKRADILTHLKQYNVLPTITKCLIASNSLKEFFEQYHALNQEQIFEETKRFQDVIFKKNQEDKTTYEYWIKRAFEQFEQSDPFVKNGVAFILFHNLICLRNNEAIYIKAGVPHSYLKGLGYEIITNSDNVIRSGLTTKKIDMEEFLKVANFNEVNLVYPELTTKKEGVKYFKYPSRDFALNIITSQQQELKTYSQQLLFIKKGYGKIYDKGSGEVLEFQPYDCFFIEPNTICTIEAKLDIEVYHIFSPRQI